MNSLDKYAAALVKLNAARKPDDLMYGPLINEGDAANILADSDPTKRYNGRKIMRDNRAYYCGVNPGGHFRGRVRTPGGSYLYPSDRAVLAMISMSGLADKLPGYKRLATPVCKLP